jgi:hypothetical protein
MTGEQWSERDRAFIDDAMRDVNVPYGERIMIKRWSSIADPGDPINGRQAKQAYIFVPVKAVITSLSQSDIVYSGGIYQPGDMHITLTQKLNFVDSAVQTGGTSQGDHIIYREHEYRIVGRFDPETVIDRDKVYIYAMRKVGNK